jgi:hypothetical protein
VSYEHKRIMPVSGLKRETDHIVSEWCKWSESAAPGAD